MWPYMPSQIGPGRNPSKQLTPKAGRWSCLFAVRWPLGHDTWPCLSCSCSLPSSLSLCISCCPICLRLLLSFTPDPPSQCGIESSCLLVPALVSCLQGCRTRRLWPDLLLLLLFLFPTPDSQTRPDQIYDTHTHTLLLALTPAPFSVPSFRFPPPPLFLFSSRF